MRWVTADGKTLQIHEKSLEINSRPSEKFEESLTNHAIHELLFDPVAGNPLPCFPAWLAARASINGHSAPHAVSATSRALVWVDPTGTFYPPAVIGPHLLPANLYVLRPRNADLIWTIAECLRCQAIGAVVAPFMQRPTRVEVRQLQLAAEKGGGIGLLLRPNLVGAGSHIYAAATRWLISPASGERTIQRWRIQLIHGHGRQIGQSFILEKHRASGHTNLVHPSAPLVYRPTMSAAS